MSKLYLSRISTSLDQIQELRYYRINRRGSHTHRSNFTLEVYLLRKV